MQINKNVFRIVPLVTGALMLWVSPALANVLANSGFETGDFTGWTVGGNTVESGISTDGTDISTNTNNFFDPTSQNVRSGQFGAYGIVRGNPIERIFLTQTVSVAANSLYNVGFYVGVDSPFSVFAFGLGAGLNEILVDGTPIAGLAGGGNLLSGSTPAAFRLVSGDFMTGAAQTILEVSYRIQGSGNGRAGFSIDDLFFTAANQIPEPGTLALFGLGLVGLGVARRRKAA